MARPDIEECLQLYAQAKALRQPRENQFRLNAAYCLPRDYAFWTGEPSLDAASRGNVSNEVQQRFAFDNTGMRSLPKFVAICKRLATPSGVRYLKLEADNYDLMKIYNVRVYFDALTDKLFKKRNAPSAMFETAQSQMYGSLGVYGTAPKSVMWRKPTPTDRVGGFKYKAHPLYNIFILVDDDGNVTHVCRRFALNPRQFRKKFPDVPLPASLSAAATAQDGGESKMFEFVHIVSERGDYVADTLDLRRMQFTSNYICVGDKVFADAEEGFVSNPYIIPRVATIAGDPYGYAPAEQAFPALGGVSAMKKTVIKHGHRAVAPPLLASDEGVLSGRIDMRPDMVTYGGLDRQGRPMIQAFDGKSNFRVAEQLIIDERKDIEDSFFVTLFQILQDTPEMTAAEVYERITQTTTLVAPTMASLQSEDQGKQVERELAVLAEHGELLPPPPELLEAKGQYSITYTSPMARNLYAEEVTGFMRWTEVLMNAAHVTGDPRPADWINWDDAAPEIGMRMAVRTSWVATQKQVQERRDIRGQQAQTQQMIDAAPAGASMMATMAKTQAGARK